MAKVTFSSEQQKVTGVVEVEIAATTYRDLVTQLLSQFPKLDALGLRQMAVAIDGEIIHEPLLESVGADSDVHFFTFIAGG